MLLYPARLRVTSRGKSQFFDHPEEVWRWLEMWYKVGLGPSGRSGVGSARTSGVDGTDWRRRGDGPLRVSAQRCDNSVSRIEIQQDGTMRWWILSRLLNLLTQRTGGRGGLC
ncbi:hypothetical protein NDU88_006931 [Pleurodeles waltl]|uniref:Uncharacterized protein n=1 Tax=Pleurodeles waltl TaxID=8319 RepID=A0AAV7VP10_PLEWA|nr:hypothetical protein NDU88_006931 [Pleurodeles waltl]